MELPELIPQAGEFDICVCSCCWCESSRPPGTLTSSLIPVTVALLRAWYPLCSQSPWLRPIKDIAPRTRLTARITAVLIIWRRIDEIMN